MCEERIVANPAVLLGKPVIRGTRISVELILEELAAGATEEQIREGYPFLTPEDIRAAVRYALDVLRSDVVYPVSAQ
ncbi:MAG: DUF433 domain-containing protein [Tepidiformaceae bacterium]